MLGSRRGTLPALHGWVTASAHMLRYGMPVTCTFQRAWPRLVCRQPQRVVLRVLAACKLWNRGRVQALGPLRQLKRRAEPNPWDCSVCAAGFAAIKDLCALTGP